MANPTAPTSTRLQQAAELIKAGDRAAAYAILRELAPQIPNDWRVWWSLAHASTNTGERVQALQRVLNLKPDHTKAAELLQKLRGSAPAAASPTPGRLIAPASAQPRPSGTIQPLSSARTTPPPAAAPVFGAAGAFGSDDPFPEAAVESASPFGAQPWGAASEPWDAPGSSPFDAPSGGAAPWETDNPFDSAPASSSSLAPWESQAPAAFGSPSTASGIVGRPLAPASASAASGSPDTKKFAMIMVGTAAVLIVIAVGLVIVNGLSGGISLGGSAAPNNFTGGDPYRTVGGGQLTVNGAPASAGIYNLNDAHNWVFEGRAGESVVIEAVTIDDCDPRIKLIDPVGVLLYTDDDGGGYPNAFMTYTLPVTGTYTVRVDVFRTGRYSLTVRDY